MRICIHKAHNRFPYILHYLWPRLLNGITRGVNGAKIYKWLWWFIELPAKKNNKVTGKTSYNNESDAILQRYNELLFAVARKFPNETRHQIALRYIQQAEQFDSGSVAKQAHVS